MKKEILVNAGAGEIRTAVVEDGRLQEFFVERTLGLGDGAARRRGRAARRRGVGLVGYELVTEGSPPQDVEWMTAIGPLLLCST